jgi:hypothetical protein
MNYSIQHIKYFLQSIKKLVNIRFLASNGLLSLNGPFCKLNGLDTSTSLSAGPRSA